MSTADLIRHHLALLHAPGVGPTTFARLLAREGDLTRLFRHPPEDLPAPLRDYLRNPDWGAVESDLAWLEGADHHLLIRGGAEYPPRLAELRDAPPLLFVKGSVALLHTPQLAVVGSRNPTKLGEETARDFARSLARVGITITSGLALGIDAAAHQGALAAEGGTIAVLGTGPDRIYPARHRDLAHALVAAGGALVSELPPGTPPMRHSFPQRNRIISGLALGTLVVEAALHSGSLITARQAGEQGREVFAIPGSIHNPLARGCHRLIREGAKLVESAQDLLEELALPLRQALDALPPSLPEMPSSASVEGQDPDYACLMAALDDAPTPVDRLVERSGLTPDVVSSMLLIMELDGRVTATAGGYMRLHKRSD